MDNILKKSALMSYYLFFILNEIGSQQPACKMTILTPQEPAHHGCQVSLFFREGGRDIYDRLIAKGIFADWREPGVIRIAPVPLYNSFSEIYAFGHWLEEALR